MRNILAAVLTGALLCGASFAQNTAPPSPDPSAPQQPQAQPQQQASPQQAVQGSPSSSTPRIAPGSVIPVQLTKTIDAKKAKTGDEVEAKVTQDMKTNGGDVLVPKDTKVVGHVTQSQARSKEQKESTVGIAFDHAVMKSGDVQLPMAIQAIIGPQNDNPNGTAGNNQPYPAPSGSASGGAPSSASSGRASGMGGSATPPPSGAGMPNDSPSSTSSSPQITAQTQGVIGISHLTLSPGANGTQGSVVSSDKNNVKLVSGTLLLLRVNK